MNVQKPGGGEGWHLMALKSSFEILLTCSGMRITC